MKQSKLKIEAAKPWFDKGKREYESAVFNLKFNTSEFDTVCFLAQQSVEKTLKGFLVLHNIDFEKTHDLAHLIDLASKLDSSLLDYKDECHKLTPYWIETRYPLSIPFEKTKEEAEWAVELAGRILEFIERIKNTNKQ